MWTLPTPDDTVSTDRAHDPDRATHDGLPPRIRRVLAAFGHPADTLILTSPDEADHPRADPPRGDHRRGGAVCPDVRDAPPRGGSVARRDDAGSRAHGTDDRLPAQAGPGHHLVVVEVGCRGLDDRSAAAVAAHLAPGATLAVLTHSHRTGGRLFDPSGAVIAALQDADLLYLQHIVIVEHPLDPQPAPVPAQPKTADDDTATGVPGRGLVDLTLFLRPGSPPQPRAENGAAV